jgi:bifunctional UDP-N-acetylglucosamine pyrophosphorylase / glucosamine-1-phosphate N-acetyltransferase
VSGLAAIILAAGQGTRMRSKYPKALHPLLGRPMLKYVTDVAEGAGSNPIAIVIGFEGEQVIRALGADYHYIWQYQQLGTGHAIIAAKEVLSTLSGDLLVLYGDTPSLRVETVKELIALKQKTGAKAAILTAILVNPSGYGRIVRNSNDEIVGIVEDKDTSPAQKEIQEINTGVYCFNVTDLLEAIAELTPQNAQGEYYLTDVFKIFGARGLKIAGLKTDSAQEAMGPNDRCQLANTEKILKLAIHTKWMRQGVTIQDPDFTYIGPEVQIGRDTIILPGTFLLGRTKIGENCVIGPHTRILDSVVESDTCVQFSQVIEAHLGQGNTVGPFSFVRPGTISESGVKIGDFVEIKDSHIGTESKIPHLSYIGDTKVGSGVNIGAGTITCNYDGLKKYRTQINDNAFIGSNTNLVAPVEIGRAHV